MEAVRGGGREGGGGAEGREGWVSCWGIYRTGEDGTVCSSLGRDCRRWRGDGEIVGNSHCDTSIVLRT